MTPGVEPVLLYIDPGLGFLALQMLAGGLLGGVFFFRRALLVFMKRLRGAVGRKEGIVSEQDEKERR